MLRGRSGFHASAGPWQNARMQSYRHRHSGLALLLGLAIAVSGCGSAAHTVAPTMGAPTAPGSSASAAPASPLGSSSGPSAAGSPDQADQAVYAAIESQVEALRGLPATNVVKPVLLDSKGVSDWLTKANAEQTNHAALANDSRLLIHLGLLPAGSSLEQLELDLQAGQVIGFYDPVSKGLYVLSQSGGVGPLEKLTFSHEYTHALQDQNFGLDNLATDTVDQGDRDLARIALPEGDATLVMTLWSANNLSLGDLLSIAGQSVSGPEADQLANAPAILRETMVFPYEDGLRFVQGIYNKGGWAAVDKLYANPPGSTSQILHPELYTGHVEPVTLTVPQVPAALGSGWKLTMQDTMGELQLRIWLEGNGGSASGSSAAANAVSSWAGDRIALYEGPSGQWAVVLHTAWRSTSGRDAFNQAAEQTLAAMGSQYRICGDPMHVDIAIASSETLVPEFIACNTMG
jgi:hypothetical protein